MVRVSGVFALLSRFMVRAPAPVFAAWREAKGMRRVAVRVRARIRTGMRKVGRREVMRVCLDLPVWAGE
jgi:hypothetical protein